MRFNTAPDERPISAAELGSYTFSKVKTWIGGYRNRPQEWTEPLNWYPKGVPDWQDKVVIGGYGRHRCHVATGVDEVLSVHVLRQATLHIAKLGGLTINGLFADPLGLVCSSGLSNEGTVEVVGNLALRNTSDGGIYNGGIISNRGSILADTTVTRDLERWGRYIEMGSRHYLAM